MKPPLDYVDVPDETEPEDNIPEAVMDRLAWDADFMLGEEDSDFYDDWVPPWAED